MSADGAFSVEDFLEAITSQLDRTQDALRLKAVNRPLTYAIRDFSMELKVFVELGPDGRVMFRPSASDDSGASVVHIGFTTVNRTMIDENTVSMSAVRSPALDELGLDEQERRQLERLGVRNAAQLDQLRRTTGETAVARFSGLPVARLRQALAQGRPSVRAVRPVDPARPRDPAPSVATKSPSPPGALPVSRAPRAGTVLRDALDAPVEPRPPQAREGGEAPPSLVRLPGATRRVLISGPRLDEAAQHASLGGQRLEVHPVDDGVEVDLGEDPTDGTLELDLGADGVVALALQFDAVAAAPEPPPSAHAEHDPWRSP